ncbi:MAG TPA: hypothetical protein VEA58_11625 [Anaerovoracaceae bacterium]|nr:hypothetical protein [Anaerovoracaceae bacterium]
MYGKENTRHHANISRRIPVIAIAEVLRLVYTKKMLLKQAKRIGRYRAKKLVHCKVK